MWPRVWRDDADGAGASAARQWLLPSRLLVGDARAASDDLDGLARESSRTSSSRMPRAATNSST